MGTVLITGASSGIGKASAHYFSDRGWNVAATMRNTDKGAEFNSRGNMLCTHLDVTDTASIRLAIRRTTERFGSIDVVVNNAAFSLTGPFEGASAEQIQNLYDVDVFGVMNVMREVLPVFRAHHAGTIVNISSLGGLIGMPMSSFYASAKWAIEGFSESIRFELKKLNIKIKVVEPGGVRTNFADNAIIVRKRDVASYEETMEKRLAAYEQRRSKLSDPVVVAKVIYRAATDNRNTFRYLAGNDAKTVWRLRKLLPFSTFTTLLERLAG